MFREDIPKIDKIIEEYYRDLDDLDILYEFIDAIYDIGYSRGFNEALEEME